MEHMLKVGMAQIAPVWLDKMATLEKIRATITEAASENTELLVFGEAFLPGYPFWLAYTEKKANAVAPRLGASWRQGVGNIASRKLIRSSCWPTYR